VTGRPTSPDDVTSAEQPIVFVIDDESMRRALTNLFQSVSLRWRCSVRPPNSRGASFRMLPAVWSSKSGAWIERLGLSTQARQRRTFM
jgi:hypothetical protein